jgi:beta-lactamase class A
MQAALNYAKELTFGDKLMYDLAHTIWNTGLNRYITEVQVAHKEGDVTGVADDVGVVYANHPYILSIMSQGHDDVELGFEQIGQISRMVYDYQAGLEAPKAP